MLLPSFVLQLQRLQSLSLLIDDWDAGGVLPKVDLGPATTLRQVATTVFLATGSTHLPSSTHCASHPKGSFGVGSISGGI